MFLLPKSFEQSLRSTIIPAKPAQPGSGLNPAFHKGCTGKAHACGTLKSKLLNAPTTGGGSTVAGATSTTITPGTKGATSHRKNSISSETISDSGSENSAIWHLNEAATSADAANVTLTTISNNINNNGNTVATKACRLTPQPRRKLGVTTNSNTPPFTPRTNPRCVISPSPSSSSVVSSCSTTRRRRLHSDSEHTVTDGNAGQTPTQQQQQLQHSASFKRAQEYRSFRVSNKRSNKINQTSNIRPPWNSNCPITKAASKTNNTHQHTAATISTSHHNNNNSNNNHHVAVSSSSSSPLSATTTSSSALLVAGNRTFRGSFRRQQQKQQRDVANWQALWERSLALRGYGATSAVYRNYDEAIKQKSRNGNAALTSASSTISDNNNAAATTTTLGEHVWLVHRGGFCAAVRLPQTKEHLEHHKVVIQLLHNGEEMSVDEDDIERQNAPTLDLIEDICELKQLNEASVLHCLRQRFANNLIHTKAGPTLLVVNPMAPLSLYSEKVVSMFRGCKTEDMPPHIYSLAQTAYRAMLETRRDQSLIFMGRSGSGKTTSFKHALYYLALAAGSYNNFLNAEKINSVNIILEAFGNTKTCLNTNATRLTQLLSLDFDQTGQISSASVQVLLPERQRAGRRQLNEHSFHIMTRLLAGAEGLLQKELHLENIPPEDNHPFVSLSQKLEERHRAAAEFMRTAQAFETLNIDAKAVRGVWSILAAIYHLGIAGVTKLGAGPASRIQFANPSAARRAAGLLGVSLEDLSAAAFNTTQNGGGSTSPAKSPIDTPEYAWESLEALVIGLYSEALAAVVALINKAICTSAHTIASIMLVDTPGFQNPASCGIQTGASLTDLRHNYLQERLQLLFHHTTLVAPRDRYAQELVEIDTEGMPESHPGPLVSLIDKAPQNHVVRSSQRDLREHDRRGMLWLLDEESMYPNSNDDTFLERLFSHYGDREHQALLRKCSGPRQFVLQHLQGTNPVLYTVDGWVRHSREHPAVRNAVTLLQDSSREEISRLYIGSLTRGAGGIVFCGSIAGLEGTQSLRRVSSIRRSFTSAGVKRNSIMLQVKFTVDGIIDTLRRTGTHFVHCYLLQHNAGQHNSFSSSGSPNTSALQTSSEEMVNVPLLRSQLRGSQVLEAARLHRLGFPEIVPLAEFIRRFGLLAGSDIPSKDITIEQILSANEVDVATYRIGPSQVSTNSFCF